MISLFTLQANPSTSPVIPLEERRDGFYATVDLPGGPPAHFLIATGTYNNFVNKRGEARLLAAGAKTNADGTLSLPSIALSGFVVPDVRFVRETADDPAPLPKEADGLLGCDVLARYRVGLDFRSKEMRLWSTEGSAASVVASWFGTTKPTSTPLSVKDGVYYVPVDLDGALMPLCVDTTSPFSRVNTPIIKGMPWKVVSTGTVLTVPPTAINFYGVNVVRIGELTFPGSSAVVDAGTTDDPLIGRNLLQPFRMLFDYTGKRAYFSL